MAVSTTMITDQELQVGEDRELHYLRTYLCNSYNHVHLQWVLFRETVHIYVPVVTARAPIPSIVLHSIWFG